MTSYRPKDCCKFGGLLLQRLLYAHQPPQHWRTSVLKLAIGPKTAASLADFCFMTSYRPKDCCKFGGLLLYEKL